jgi:hypothetical protein
MEIPHPCLNVNELAFTVRVTNLASLGALCPAPKGAVCWSREPLVNLETVNYILAGIQVLTLLVRISAHCLLSFNSTTRRGAGEPRFPRAVEVRHLGRPGHRRRPDAIDPRSIARGGGRSSAGRLFHFFFFHLSSRSGFFFSKNEKRDGSVQFISVPGIRWGVSIKPNLRNSETDHTDH